MIGIILAIVVIWLALTYLPIPAPPKNYYWNHRWNCNYYLAS